ncbi:hypothetical protein WN55_01695 [Dufourea novaeangliae]|uniref:Uncharacterized protein n=1 Tax=Dufourea novaeangliae TaxID=178035 RepID=A0A154PGK8_DUFNO|nr:hypothetical protein WN55_01695 [Dufourea novaeangliae]
MDLSTTPRRATEGVSDLQKTRVAKSVFSIRSLVDVEEADLPAAEDTDRTQIISREETVITTIFCRLMKPRAENSVNKPRKNKEGNEYGSLSMDVESQQSIIGIRYKSPEDSGSSPTEEELHETEDKLAAWGTRNYRDKNGQ